MKFSNNIFRGSLLIVFPIVFMIALMLNSCGESVLEPEIFSQTAPDNLFNSLEGVESVLYGAHANAAENAGNDAAQQIIATVTMTDIGFVTAGNIANWATDFQDFVLDGVSSRLYAVLWNRPYMAIRNVNLLLENLDEANISDADREIIRAEAKFIRAMSYYKLYIRFGPVPLRTSTDQELELPRAQEEEYLSFIESEFIEAMNGLPPRGEEKAYGRAHREAAMAYLTKFYLNTKQWQKSAQMAQDLINTNKFNLYPDYFELFQPQNEVNDEFIWARVMKEDLGREASLSFMNFAWPTNFKTHPRTGLTFCNGCRNFATMLRFRDDFWLSFEEGDERTSLILEEYINTNDELIDLRPPNDNPRPFKYWPDDDFVVGPGYGNDVPDIRYADILLSRAEALNEINGPNQDSIDLINKVRNRAGLSDLNLEDFSSTDELRDHILKERGWELWWEGKRREDLIRHGEFIKRAQERGLPAQDHHVRHPIPLFALDANPSLEQNPGY